MTSTPDETTNTLDGQGTPEEDSREGGFHDDAETGAVNPLDENGVGEETEQEYGVGVDGAPVASSQDPPAQES